MSGEEYTYYDLAISMAPVGAHTKVTDVSSVVTITNSNEKTLKLWVQAEDQAMRYRVDGTDPDSTTGFLLGSTEWIVVTVPVNSTIKFIETGTGGILQYQWLE